VEGAKVCERIRAALEEISWPRHPERKITASFGVAGASTASALSPASWVEASDRNLYAAKKGGRNRVVHTDVTSQANLRAAS
jgi:PleD family two-component response regulator